MMFEEALAKFLAYANSFRSEYVTIAADESDRGRKYLRIVSATKSGSSKSVYCFIERATGNVLKAESWKKPAKHTRGTIFTEDTSKYGVTPYGAHYLKG